MKRLMFAAVAAMACAGAWAEVKHYVGTDGKFDTATNWRPEGKPVAGDDLVFDNDAAVPQVVTMTASSPTTFGTISGLAGYTLKAYSPAALTISDATDFKGEIWMYRSANAAATTLTIPEQAGAAPGVGTLVVTGSCTIYHSTLASTATVGRVKGNGSLILGRYDVNSTVRINGSDPESLIHPFRDKTKNLILGDGSFGTVSFGNHNVLNVPEGTARVRTLWAGLKDISSFVKNGAGTLSFENYPQNVPITVKGGAIKVAKRNVTIPANPTLPEDPLFHVDPNVAGTIDYWVDPATGETTDKVACWHDVRYAEGTALCAATDSDWIPLSSNGKAGTLTVTNRPTLAVMANGLKAVNLGTFLGSKPKDTTIGDATSLRFENGAGAAQELSFRSGFIVLKPNNPKGAGGTSGFFFGAHGSYNWHANADTIIDSVNAKPSCRLGRWFLDGVRASMVDYEAQVSADIHVISFDCEQDQPAENFGRDRADAGRYGGYWLCEVVVYNRNLSDEERRAGEAYLMGKWMGKAHPCAAPQVFPTLSLAAGVAPIVDTDVDLTITNTAWNGVLTKRGEGAVTMASGAGITGFRVEGGVLTSAPVSVRPVLHLDASAPGTVEISHDAVLGDYVSKWTDCDGGANYAYVKPNGTDDLTSLYPVVSDGYSTTKRDAITMPAAAKVGETSYSGGHMYLNARITAVKEAFVVWTDVGSASGNHFILGDTGSYDFHRGSNGYLLLSGTASMSVNGETWHDGEYVDPSETKPAPEDLHVTTFHSKSGSYSASIGSLARDRAVSGRVGGMRYCEVIVYDQPLSEVERAEIRAKLQKKWQGVDSPVAAYTRIGSLSVAKDAKFVREEPVSVSALGADGGEVRVAGLLLEEGCVLTVSASKAGVKAITVDGDVTLPAACTVNVACDGTRPKNGRFPILKAKGGTIVVPEGVRVRDWTLGGSLFDFSPRPHASLKVDGDTLYLVIDPGLMILLK